MKLFKIVCLTFTCLLALPVLAVVTNRAEDYYEVGSLSKAEQLFRERIVSNSEDAGLSYYYLGAIHRESGRQDSAQWYFITGLSKYSENPYLQFGKLSLERYGDAKGIDKQIDQLVSGHKKEPSFLRAVASYYMTVDTVRYQGVLQTLMTMKSEMARNSLLQGDYYMEQKAYGLASQQYEQAIYYDSKLEIAYVKYAELYTHINPSLAVEKLNAYLLQNPSAPLVLRELADVYFLQGDFSEAVRSYEDYFANDGNTLTQDMEKYATILFYSKAYDKAMACVQQVLAVSPNNLVMNRLRMYISSVQGAPQDALQLGKTFMSSYGSSDYLVLDHYYFAQILRKNKSYADALSEYEYVIHADSTKCDVLFSIVETSEAMQNYHKAVTAYERYIGQCVDLVKNSDYFKLGQDYYYLANSEELQSDSLSKLSYLVKADQMFEKITSSSPESSVGYFWRARTQASIDSETLLGLAKPFYEKTLEILLPEKKDVKKIVECYNYLGYYYYLKSDMTTSLSYWTKTLELDPKSIVAQRAIEGIQTSGKTVKK